MPLSANKISIDILWNLPSSVDLSNTRIFRHTFLGTVRPRKLKLGTHVDSGQMYHVYRNQDAAAYLSLYFFIFLSLLFSTLKIFITIFSGIVRPRRLKRGTHLDSEQLYHVYQNQAAAHILPLFLHFSFCPIFNIEIFRHDFLGNCEAKKIENLYTRGRWADVSCLTESGRCCLFIPFFFIFLYLQFSTLKYFVTLFSGTVRSRRMKLSTHLDSGQMYCVYQNQAAAAYSSLYFSIFLSFQFSNIKFFVIFFSGTVRSRRLKLGTHMDNGQMYCVYRNQGAAAYLSLYFFIFLSLQFSNIKMFRHTLLTNCEA